jgi:hypothetical protein
MISHLKSHSAQKHRNHDWKKFNLQLTSGLWKNDEAMTLDKQRSLKIIYDLYWHGGNRSKDQQLNEVQQQELAKCPLCNARCPRISGTYRITILQSHNEVLQCSNTRDHSGLLTITTHHAKLVTKSKGPYRTVLQRCIAFWPTQRVQANIHMWIGRWPVDERAALLNDIPTSHPSQ